MSSKLVVKSESESVYWWMTFLSFNSLLSNQFVSVFTEVLLMVCNLSLEIREDNGMAAMLDDKTKSSVIQHGCHTIVVWISRDWLQTSYKWKDR